MTEEESKLWEDFLHNEVKKSLNKYILVHCAQKELSLIDLNSGRVFEPSDDPNSVRKDDLMQIKLRQNIQNFMFFEDMTFQETIMM